VGRPSRTSTIVWCADAPARSTRRPPSAPGNASRAAWCRGAIVAAGGLVVTRLAVLGPAPDMSIVDRLARIAVGAKRGGRRLVLSELSPLLGELLALAGLPLEVEGETEGGEEPLRIEHGEEVAQRRDPALGDLEHLDPPR
jgi:hypothetical protein